MRFSPASRGSDAWGSKATSAMDRLADAEAEQVEQLPGPVQVGVLVEGALAGGAAQLLGAAGVVQQLGVRRRGLVGVRDDEQLTARLEPALDPLVRVGDD